MLRMLMICIWIGGTLPACSDIRWVYGDNYCSRTAACSASDDYCHMCGGPR